jgi:hypothetical protein
MAAFGCFELVDGFQQVLAKVAALQQGEQMIFVQMGILQRCPQNLHIRIKQNLEQLVTRRR